MPATLPPTESRRFYDRFGAKMDVQFYENRALRRLADFGRFEQANAVFEFGCGTGRYARGLLDERLAADATYVGVDISETMVRLAGERLGPYADRARVEQSDGSSAFPLDDASVDRVVSTYVLDLLPEDAIRQVLAEAHRVLRPGGRLCLLALTAGTDPAGFAIAFGWQVLSSINPRLVGGCRPISLHRYVRPPAWRVEHRELVSAFGVCSDLCVVEPVPG